MWVGPPATTADERLEVGSLTPNKGRTAPALGSLQFRGEKRRHGPENCHLEDRKSPQQSRGRREGAGLGRRDHSGAGLVRGGTLWARPSLGPAGPREGAGRERAGLRKGRSHSCACDPETRQVTSPRWDPTLVPYPGSSRADPGSRWCSPAQPRPW